MEGVSVVSPEGMAELQDLEFEFQLGCLVSVSHQEPHFPTLGLNDLR